jgi:hypothetical protein
LDSLTSPTGSLAVAISALLLVMGFRLARPSRAREWLAVAAYAGALATQTLGALGLLGGEVTAPGTGVRLAGALLLLGGLLLAGSLSRARRRAVVTGAPAPSRRRIDAVYAGLALILLGQLLRGPSRPAAVSAAVAVLLAVWVALTPRDRARGDASSG